MPLKGHNVARQAERIFPRIGRRAMKKPGRHSQRKGRTAEFEIRDILKAAGYDAAVRGMYDPGDLLWGLCGRDRMCEVKRRHNGVEWAYRALLDRGDHAVFFKADRKPWLIIQTLDQYLKDNSHPPNENARLEGADIDEVLAALE